MRSLGFRVSRLKTGTPPRLNGKSIDYSDLKIQAGDNPLPFFSFWNNKDKHLRQVECHITHTNEKTHQIIREGLDQSPLYTGVIKSVGPRYCPSIEDKIMRFDKPSHQIFIEPEGLLTHEIYPNGISTSLSYETQIKMINSIKGFEKVEITRFGYAIEYDFYDSRDLKYSLETKNIDNLFFAGQINGTTGYEEAAAQGLVAGVNAVLKIRNEPAWVLKRSESYIGVMLDDLISRGTSEPYRMFTSRAEYRLLLREDNADLRLTPKGRELGLINDELWHVFEEKCEKIEQEKKRLASILIKPSDFEKIEKEAKALELLKRPAINYEILSKVEKVGSEKVDKAVSEQIEIQMKYEGYIGQQLQEIEKKKKHEETKIPEKFDYDFVKGLSNEVRQKFKEIKPTTIGQASRIPGVTPAAISLLIIYLKK